VIGRSLKRMPPAPLMSEDQLGWSIRDACELHGWRFLWLRKTYNSSAGILDLLLIPLRPGRRGRTALDPIMGERHILHRELKGHDAQGRLGTVTDEQEITIEAINQAGGDAAVWIPADWPDKILAELE